MSTIYVEYRPRLGAAHVYISISDQSSISTTRYSATVAPNENAIIVADHCEDGREIYKFLWPENSGKILLTGPVLSNRNNGSVISFRVRVVESSNCRGDFSVMSNLDKFTGQIIELPCFDFKPDLGKAVENVRISCSSCQQILCDRFKIRRLLPLPPSDWQDFSQDWFCGCCESHDTRLINACETFKTPVETSNRDDADVNPITNGCCKASSTEAETATSSSNKHLAIASTDPTKTGDVFYTSSALLMLVKSFGDLETSNILISAEVASIECRRCNAELGTCDNKNQLFQFWHHAVVVSQHQEEQQIIKKSTSSCETFRRMIVGIVQESLGQSVKIYFSSKITHQNLLVWVIEPNLCLLSASLSSHTDVCHQLLQNKKVMKVLFQLNSDSKADLDLNIVHLDISDKLLKLDQKMAMGALFFLHLIEALGLKKSILHPDDSPNDAEYPSDMVDKKISDGIIWDLADRIIKGKITYPDAKNYLNKQLDEILILKDVSILENKINVILPLTVLKQLRNEIIFYRLDTDIIETLDWRYDEVHNIDASSSPRLQNYIISHNRFAENLMWLQSFFWGQQF